MESNYDAKKSPKTTLLQFYFFVFLFTSEKGPLIGWHLDLNLHSIQWIIRISDGLICQHD